MKLVRENHCSSTMSRRASHEGMPEFWPSVLHMACPFLSPARRASLLLSEGGHIDAGTWIPKSSNACKHGLSMMLPTNPVPRDHAPRVGGQASCRLTVLQAALSSITETRQRVSAPNTSSNSGPARSRGKFKCGDCGRLFSTKGNMMRHAQATHARGGAKMFPCGVCGRKFKRREDLITHGRVHTGE